MHDTAGSAAAPAARCKNLRRGSFILNLPLASHHSMTSSASSNTGCWYLPPSEQHASQLRCVPARKAYSLWLRCNHRGGRPIFRKNLHDQYAKRHVCLILRGVCEVPCFKKVLAGFIDCLLAPLSESKLAGNHISNSGPNVVMDSDVAVWGKREFGGA